MKACASISSSGRGDSNGILRAVVPRWIAGGGTAGVAPHAAHAQDHATALQLSDVLRAAHTKLDQAPPSTLPSPFCAAGRAGCPARHRLRQTVPEPARIAGG